MGNPSGMLMALEALSSTGGKYFGFTPVVVPRLMKGRNSEYASAAESGCVCVCVCDIVTVVKVWSN